MSVFKQKSAAIRSGSPRFFLAFRLGRGYNESRENDEREGAAHDIQSLWPGGG